LPPNVRGTGIPFFSESEWLKAKAVMEDGKTFHKTYAEFADRVAQRQAQMAGQNEPTIRVYIDVDEFVAWCRANGRKVDAQSRATYAGLKAAQQDNDRGPAKLDR